MAPRSGSVKRINAHELNDRLFLRAFIEREPMVISGAITDSVLRADWSMEALRTEFGTHSVTTRVFDCEIHRSALRFVGLAKRTESITLSKLFDGYVDWQKSPPRETHYLRLDASTAEIPSLFTRIELPECFTLAGTGHSDWHVHDTYLRLGAHDYEYPLHCDGLENVLGQLAGHKRIVLIHPREIARVYPLAADMARSQIDDIETPDLSRFPDFDRVERFECTLAPGDLLYIPMLWFHHVRSCGWSVSASRYFKRPRHSLHVQTIKPPEWSSFEQSVGKKLY